MKNATDITIVLDRSGSMQSRINEVISGFNEFLRSQKEDKSTEATLSLIQFDSGYYDTRRTGIEAFSNVNIHDVAELNNGQYTSGGMTALNDAIGRTIDNLGGRLASMKESDRPNKVLLIVYTDGCENASKEYTLTRINEMIKHQTTKYNWEIQFIGSTLEAQAQVNLYETPTYGKMDLGQASNTVNAFAGVSKSVHKARVSTCATSYKTQLENDAKRGVDAFN